MTELVSIALPGALPEAWFETARLAYADDPRWIPEDAAAVVRDFHPLNPWFQSGRAHGFLVPGKARLCGFFDPRAVVDGKVVAYFGDFVTTGDHEAEARLFAEVNAWARAQGAERLLGPMHMATWHSYRALVSIEDGGLPFLGEPYDSPLVPAAIVRQGFGEAQHYLSQMVDRKGMEGMVERLLAAGQKAVDAGYRVEAEGIDIAISLLPTIYDQSMVIFRDNYAFTPPEKNVWLGAMRATLRRACPHSTVIARDKTGAVVGYQVNFPHWGPLVVQGASQRLRVDELDYAQHAHLLGPRRTQIHKTMGVLPEHQSSRVGTLILGRCAELGLPHYDGLVCATLRDDNRSRRYGEGFQVSERRYVLYGRDLA